MTKSEDGEKMETAPPVRCAQAVCTVNIKGISTCWILGGRHIKATETAALNVTAQETLFIDNLIKWCCLITKTLLAILLVMVSVGSKKCVVLYLEIKDTHRDCSAGKIETM